MSDIQNIRDDLAFLREVAESGRVGGPQGGVILATAGFVFGAASLTAWATFQGALPLSASQVWIPWLAATVIFYAVLLFALRAIKRQASGGAAARLAGVAWSALGGAAFTLLAACIAVQWTTGSPLVWATTPSVFLALYGSGWIIAGAAAERGWMKAVGYVSFAAGVTAAFLALTPHIWLFYGLALMAVMGVPGLVLARASAARA